MNDSYTLPERVVPDAAENGQIPLAFCTFLYYLRGDCRRKGITINSSVDCLIAQTAIENDLALLHNDADFDRMRRIAPLRIYE